MNKLYDVLEICLQELENGVSLENILARYPDLASELRPILKASIQARSVAPSAPSSEVIRRGRAKLLQRASEMREAKASSRKRVIPIFQRLALSFGVAATFLLSGTGLVGVSASALPGENLYPVKRTWEGVRLFFTFDQNTRAVVESQYEVERLHEVNELIVEGRHELIQFIGVFMRLDDMTYISGVPVLVPANLQEPEDGAAVLVTGRTNAQGFVELESLELLPDGVFVPLGLPTELESKHETNSNSGSGSKVVPDSNTNENSDENSEDEPNPESGSDPEENNNDSGAADETDQHSDFEVEGIVDSISATTLMINGRIVYLENPTIEGNLQNGVKVEIKGYYADDGRFIVTQIKVKSSESGSNGGDSVSNEHGSGSNDNNDGNTNNNNNNSNNNDNNNHSDNDNHNDNHNDNDNHNSNDNSSHDGD